MQVMIRRCAGIGDGGGVCADLRGSQAAATRGAHLCDHDAGAGGAT